jgi:hypothetical protein
VTITPIPADRTPIPLPWDAPAGPAMTLQLHGAKVELPDGGEGGIQIRNC